MVKKSKAKMKIASVLDELDIPDAPRPTKTELVPKHTDRGFLSWNTDYPDIECFKAYVGEVTSDRDYVDAEFTLSDGYNAVSVSFAIWEDDCEEKVLDKINELKNAVCNLERALEKAIEARRLARKVKE